jgi:hypothetical protein
VSIQDMMVALLQETHKSTRAKITYEGSLVSY